MEHRQSVHEKLGNNINSNFILAVFKPFLCAALMSQAYPISIIKVSSSFVWKRFHQYWFHRVPMSRTITLSFILVIMSKHRSGQFADWHISSTPWNEREKLSTILIREESPCASLHPVSKRQIRKKYQHFHLFWLHHGQNFIVHKNTDSSFFFFCQAELVTPIRNCSVDTEQIDRVNCLEQEFCIFKKPPLKWMVHLPSFASRFHDSKHWYFWR